MEGTVLAVQHEFGTHSNTVRRVCLYMLSYHGRFVWPQACSAQV